MGTADMRRRAAHALAALLTLLVFGVLLLALTPVHVRVVFQGDGTSPPVLSFDNKVRRAQSVALPALNRVDIEVLQGPVRFIAPQIPRGPRLEISDFSGVEGSWTPVETWPREIATASAGAKLTLAGWMSDRDFLFRTGPQQGRIRITTAAGQRDIDLNAATDGMTAATILSNERALIATLPFRWHALSLSVTNVATVRHIDVMIGPYPVATRAIPSGADRLDLAIGRGLLLEKLRPGLLAAADIIARALVCLLAAAVFGFGLLRFSRLNLTTGEFWLLSTASGAALFAVLAGSLAFILPTSWAAPIVASLLTAISLASILRETPRAAPQNTPPLSPLVTAAVVGGLMIAFWPLILSEGWFAGLLQTDPYEYGALAELFATKSVAAAGLHFGFGLRYTDMVPAAAMTALFGGPGMKIFPVIAVFWSVGLGMTGAFVARRLGAKGWGLTLAGVAAAYAASVHGLYVEGYFTRFVFTCLIVFIVLASLIALDETKAASAPLAQDIRPWLPFMALSAYAVSLVPYFSLFLPAAGLAIYTAKRFNIPRTLPLFAGICAGIMVLCNVNLWFLAYPDIALAYSKGADALARFTVFPFFMEARFPAMVAGLTPKHWDSTIAAALANELVGGGSKILLYQKLFSAINSAKVLGIGTCLLLLPVGWVMFRIQSAVRQTHAVFIISLFALMAAAILVLGKLDRHLYANLNLAWTAGALIAFAALPFCLAMVSGAVGAPFHRWLAAPVMVVVIAFTGANILTLLADTSGYAAHPDGKAVQGHVRVLPAIIAAETELRTTQPGTATMRIVGQFDEIARTDSDRVLFNAMAAAYRAKGIGCSNCSYGGGAFAVAGIQPMSACTTSPGSVALVLGAATETCPNTVRRQLTPLLSIQR